MSEWIKCSERMPEEGEDVIVYARYGYGFIARYIGDFVLDGYVKCVGVTHWMPLPESLKCDECEVIYE